MLFARLYRRVIVPDACGLIKTYSRYAMLEPNFSTSKRLLNVDACAVAVDSVLGRATSEGLGSLLENYKSIVSTYLEHEEHSCHCHLPIKCWLLIGYPWF
jgi:hypothetical protein